MQDRYAGDIGDYGKIALLRQIQAQGLSIAINWYRVEPLDVEKNADGSYKQEDGKYLIPDYLFACDEELAVTLTQIAKSKNRSVKALEKKHLIPGAKYYSEPISVVGRDEWHKLALNCLEGFDVVFLDPDNGLLVKSVGKRSARSVKYTFYEEVRDYINRGQSVIVYNHRCRKPEEQYFNDICNKLEKETGIQKTEMLKMTFPKCSVRDYIAVPAKKEHRKKLIEAFCTMEQSRWGKMGVCRIS